jgi:DNA-binding SARP family transcriptional activator
MLEFAILGPLEVSMDDLVVLIGGYRQRALLAMLLLHANEVLSSDRLLEELWGGEPRTDTAALRVRISQLRKALQRACGRQPIETKARGYVLSLEREQLDLWRFERLATAGSAALDDDPATAAVTLRDALALWRGPPLAEFAYEPFAQTAIGRLEELRVATLEKRIDAELALGLERDLVGELRTLVAEHPLQEHFCEQLMLALYRVGRQAEALDVFREKRRLLTDELGIEPGPALQDLQRAILAQDEGLQRPSLEHSTGPRRAEAVSQVEHRLESRKTVTVLVCDVAEATSQDALPDAEVMRHVRERYLQTSVKVLTRHGGTVEPYIGDVVMAVFGVPVTHEDDALRAVRAAFELQKEVGLLNVELKVEWKVWLTARLGVETGEVLAEDGAPGRTSVTGAAVHAAARLQQAAEASEIMLGETVWSLVRNAVSAEFARTLPLTGTGDEVAAWRLLDVDETAPPIPRRFDTPFVGRSHELAQLRRVYERTSRQRTPCLFTIFGEAGIGKTRLAEEARLDLLAESRVLVGRCLPYGEGVTYVALREIVRQALGDRPSEALPFLLAEESDGERVAAAVNALLGLVSTRVALEEAFWGVRRLCETLARTRPLVLVFEDVHWAEASMLDLIEYIARTAGDAPLLLLCLARHDLLDRRPRWGSGAHAATVSLAPLTQRESELLATWLIRERGAADATREVVDAAQGNPLFVEQLIAMLADSGQTADERRLPANVEALLAARLEVLGPAARLVLERASVIGDRFQMPALARLVPDEIEKTLAPHLRALVRRQLLRPTRSAEGDDGYRFRHVLVREAAYRRLPKELRSELHERYGDGLASAPALGGAGGRDELIGYHLERAHAYRVELGAEDTHARRLADRATNHLAAAAAEAFARTDFRAVDQLLATATPLMADDDPRRAPSLYDRGTSLVTLGRPAEASAVLAEAIDAARALNDDRSEWRARLDRVAIANNSPSTAMNIRDQARLARDGVRILGRLNDDRGLVRAWRLAASVATDRGRASRMQAAAEQMLRHARRSGVYREEAWALWVLAEAILVGPAPATAGINTCNELLGRRDELRVGDVGLLGTLALLHAMQGHFDEGRQLIAQGRELMEGLGHKKPLLATIRWRGDLELMARDWAAAEDALREAGEFAAASGLDETGASLRARAQMALGHVDEAEKLVLVARDGALPACRPAQALWRSVYATVLAARGASDGAVELAREAARLLRRSDFLSLRGDVHIDLATAFQARGDPEGAMRAVQHARDLYEQKGNSVAAQRIREAAPFANDRA